LPIGKARIWAGTVLADQAATPAGGGKPVSGWTVAATRHFTAIIPVTSSPRCGMYGFLARSC